VLVARIRAILRNRRKHISAHKESGSKKLIKQEGALSIDNARHRITLEGDILELTLSEFALLDFLTEHKGWVFT